MASYTIISNIGNTIVKILKNNLVPDVIQKADSIGLCNPYERGDFTLGIYLYDIMEYEDVRINTMLSGGVNTEHYPPKFYSLYYMITPYSTSDVKFRSSEEQNVIGKVLQVLSDNSQIVVGGNETEVMDISLMKIPSEEKPKIWNIPNQAYKTSLFYKVSPVRIDSLKKRSISRVIDLEFTVEEK